MSSVEGIKAIQARVARIRRRARPGQLAHAVEREYVRQMRARAGQIPVDTGDLLGALTRDYSPDRVVTEDAQGVSVEVRLPQAYWQRHRLPEIDGAQMARAIAGAMTGDGR